MPSKSQAGNRSKQESSKERLSSAKSNNESVKKVCIWPVWSDTDVEKQDQAISGKGRDKAKASLTPALYEDAEGVVLPPSLLSMGEVCWKRPTELGSEEMAVVKDPFCSTIDLTSNNAHIMHSKFVSWLVSEVCALWRMRGSLPPQTSDEEIRLDWAPWAHIYPQSKSSQLNPLGKYYIKLFWMGSWRRVIIDDSLPFLDKGEEVGKTGAERLIPLYPRTGNAGEIWPALLMKALLKVNALDALSNEFGDFSVTYSLTGWVPQVMSLELSERESIWNSTLLPSLPLWVRGGEESEQVSRDVLVMASVRELGEQIISVKKKSSVSSETEQIQTTVEGTLKEAGLLPSTFDMTSPVFPLLLTQARDEPLLTPPSTPPPPVLQFPFYLGLTNRERDPSVTTPPPTPPSESPWFVEIAPRVGEFSEERQGEIEKEREKEGEGEGEKNGGPVWLGYSDFIKCFSHLYVYRNPSSFKHKGAYVDLSRTFEEPTASQSVKKGASTSTAQLGSSSKVLPPHKDNLLFVDSPRNIILNFVLSSLSNWREGGKNTNTVPIKSPFTRPSPAASEGVIEGRLIVEPFHWNIVQTSSPLLRVKSSGTTGATLSLPPGRHVLKIHAKSPIAYHVGVFSDSEFHLMDEDSIYTALSKESSLYVSFCSEFIESLISAASHFGDTEGGLEESLDPLISKLTSIGLTAQHANLLLACVLEVWGSHSKEHSLTNQMKFAWKAFLYKSFAVIEQKLPDSEVKVDVLSLRRSLSVTGPSPPAETTSEASPEEHQAASVITLSIQKHVDSRRRQSMIPGTERNKKAVQEIEKSLPSIEPHVSKIGLAVFKAVFDIEPGLKPRFPFHFDESRRCFSTLCTGSFPPLAPHSWTLVLRAVFQIPSEQTMVPHFSSPIPSTLLRVINNDTMTELPRLFHATPPLKYTPNTHGYTMQVEAWCGDSEGVEGGGKWRLQLVSSSEQLPALVGGEEELSVPHTQETMDYCLPDRDNVLLRYTLTPSKDLPVSLHLTMSKQDAWCKFQLLDDEECLCSVEGRRVCIIPLHFLQSSSEDKTHKYVVQAVILRDSWPKAESAWPYISVIRSSEKLEEGKDGNKPGSGKKSRAKGASTKKSSTPSNTNVSQPLHNIDTSKPHWILRVATNAGDKDQLSVAKDTEKADALQAMVQAWETEQPGRSQKALESRRKFLESRGVKEDQLAIEGQARFEPVSIEQMDLSPFIVNEGPPKLLDESDLKLRVQERQKLFKDYRSERQRVLEIRNLDREARNEAKVKQLQKAEEWQCELDRLRNKLNSGREAIRERHLKKEKARLEAERSHHEEHPPPTSGRESKAAKGKAGKGKKK